MNAARTRSFRYAMRGLAALCAIGLLAACDKPESAGASAGAAQQAQSPCLYPRTNATAGLSESDEALLAAAAAGDLRGAGQSLEQGANVNAVGSLKRTPLFVAAFCDRPQLVKLLLDKGGKHDVTDSNGMSPLHAAVVIGGIETARILVASGANINSRDTAGRTALHVAAATNQVSLVELLLEGKANIAIRDKNGMTAASLARDNGHSTPGVAIKQWQEKQKTPRPK